MPRHAIRIRFLLLAAVCLALSGSSAAATLQAKTLAAYEKYLRLTEQRFERDLQAPEEPATREVRVRRMQTLGADGKPLQADGGMIHHWKGIVFIPGAKLDQVLAFVQDYDLHHKYFSEVQRSKLLSRDGDTFKIFYRLKRTKVITVVYNAEQTVVYQRHGPGRASSRSVATKIAELDDTGTATEREKRAGEDHGFLWRLNSFWRFEERDGGVVVSCESVSLSRSIPFGLAFMIRGFVESVPRESLVGILTSLKQGVSA